ncbi:MAG TPA: hypothetical protein H9867_02035, partial [Candidatus Corynebacterium gallistercoris]|nr:hypothetical protein [Candidatus Corynebacterium gallistercoris]
HIFRQDAVFHKTDHTVLRILVKFPWHVPNFPIYSNGTKPGTLQSQYVSLAYSDALITVGVPALVGMVGDSYDNALAETITGAL